MLVFSFAYLALPYWSLPPTWTQKSVALTAVMGAALLWAFLASGAVRFPSLHADLPVLIFLIVALLIVSWRPLGGDIAWRGDEDTHIISTRQIAAQLTAHWRWSVAATLAVIAYLWLARRSARFSVPLLLASLALMALLAGAGLDVDKLPRYPALVKLVMALPALTAPGVAPPEWLFRLLPFACGVLTAWCAAAALPDRPVTVRLLLGLAVGTTPLLVYYQSVVYLEMPAVLLMTVVCLSVDKLLHAPARKLPGEPAWYALLLIGFVRETAAPFLAAFLLSRWLTQRPRPRKLTAIREEITVALCVLLPLVTYLLFRRIEPLRRDYHPALMNLRDPHLYVVLLRSYWEQFSVMLLPAAAGLVALLVRRQWAVALFLLATVGADVLFHLLDRKEYVGYSRFNLFVAPALIALTCVAGWSCSARWPRCTAGALAALVVGNLWLTPFHADGSRRDKWGDCRVTPRVSTIELSYPYRAACQWIQAHHAGERVLFAGMTYPYHVAYYLGPATAEDGVERYVVLVDKGSAMERLAKAMDQAHERGIDVILLHVRDKRLPDRGVLRDFKIERVFENQANVLVLLTRQAYGEVEQEATR